MEGGCGFLLLIAVVALAIFLKMRSDQKQEDAVSQAHESVRPYRQAYDKALASADSQVIMKTGSGLVEATRYWLPGDVASVAERVYRDALNLLKAHPEARPYVLSIGRSAYGARRPNGMLTVYDEQAIMNDISAHS
jgi:chitodextrinase